MTEKIVKLKIHEESDLYSSFDPDQNLLSDEVIAFTRKVTQYIIDEPAIKAVFSGHLHMNGTEQLGEKTGYILGGLFKGIVGEILID